MVVLNEALIKSKTKQEDLLQIKNLNVCGQGIEDVSILQQAPNIEVLSLSVNKISSLRHFVFCSQLKQLYLRANAVNDLAELRYLMSLSELRVLWLADNPCTKLPHYRAFVVANLPNLENLDNVAVNDADRQAAKGIRMLHPATAEDVLAEEQAAAEQLMQQMQADEQQASTQSGSRPPSATARPPLPNISPRSSNSAAAAPIGVAAAPSTIVRRNSARKSASSPEPPQPQQPYAYGPSTSGSAEQAGGHMNGTKGGTSGLSTPPPAGQSATASAPGSYRSTPEPYPDVGAHQMQQQMPRGHSVTPRDFGSASCMGVSVAAGQPEAGDMSRQLYAEHSQGSVARQFLQQHQVMQQRAWGAEQPAYQQSHCMQYSPPPPQRQQLLQLPAQWPRSPEHASVSPSASRTNVLYAVMALLGELDVSGLSIVQREVQLRLMEHQQ